MEAMYTAEEIASMPDRIAATFSGRSVFVTGGTGFIGKVLVEKLLRKCPDIKQIMLLVRPKKGKMPEQRMEDTLNDPLFEKVRTMRGGLQPLLDKMTIISGDAAEPDLGLSPADRQRIIDEANIIIHVAGIIRFDVELKKAILLNVRGTKLVIQLARECKHLLLLIHISTAYCHPHEKLLEEKPYPPPADPHQIIQSMEWMDEATVAAVTPMLLQKVPNTYTFTKALAEALAVEAMKDLPVVLLRPSIVVPIYQEPIPGWTDNINGPVGLLIAAGKGVMRSMYCKKNFYADYFPVDLFVNSIMIFAWEYIEQRVNNIDIVNVTSSAEIKFTWSEFIRTGLEIIANRLPFNGVVWYPGGSMTQSRLYHKICRALFHWLPAVLVDCQLFCLGYKPVLCRVQRRLYKGIQVFEYYTNNQWDFRSDVLQKVRKTLNERERQDYKVDGDGVDIARYIEDSILCARRYILKETDDTIPAARRHMKVMWCVDVAFRVIFWGLMLYWLSGWFRPLLSSWTKLGTEL